MLYAVTFGWLIPIYTYVLLELIMFPVQLWSVNLWAVPCTDRSRNSSGRIYC